jgi:transcriptional regulator with XRE-family HTH domain
MALSKKSGVDWKAVGQRLRQLRGFDKKQAEFARDIGISQSQLSRYEKGKSEIGAEILLRMAKKFGKSMEWLLTGEE